MKEIRTEKGISIEKKQQTSSSFKKIILLLLFIIILTALILYYIYPEIKFLIAFAFSLPILENIIKCIITIYKYFNHHLYVPLSHDEIHNKIINVEEYIQIIKSLFRFKPLPKTLNSIKETAVKEFHCYSINIEFESLFEYFLTELGITLIYLEGLLMIFHENFIVVFVGILILSCLIKLIFTIK